MANAQLFTVNGHGVLFKEALKATEVNNPSLQTYRRLRVFQAAFFASGTAPDSLCDIKSAYLRQQKKLMGSWKSALAATPITAEGVALFDYDVRSLKQRAFFDSYTPDLTFKKIGTAFIGVASTVGAVLFSPLRAILSSSIVEWALMIAGAFGVIGLPLLMTEMFTNTWKKHLQIKLSDELWRDHIARNTRTDGGAHI